MTSRASCLEKKTNCQAGWQGKNLKFAQQYLARGWAVVPIPRGSKAPVLPNWQNLQLEAHDLPRYFNNGKNVGVLLGERSGWLVDVDLDCPEALQIADFFLPPTGAIFGRESKPRSHRLYICPGAKTTRFEYGKTLVEIRSTGAQTVFPGSIHPSGEEIRWDEKGEPAHIDFQTLKGCVAKLASCVLLSRHYPGEGSRQFASMALAGWLLRNGWSREETTEFLEALCVLANDEESKQRVAQIRNTAQKVEANSPTTGFPTLKEYYPEEVLLKVAEWLGLRTERYHEGRPSRPCTDLGNAERLVEHFGNVIRHVPEWGWLVWDGKRWARDPGKHRILRLAEETVRRIYPEANEAPNQDERTKLAKWAVTSENHQRVKAMVELAAPMVLAKSEEFDADPFLLNCANGVVDLRTGELLPHTPEMRITKLAPVAYNPGADCPKWKKFLNDIFLNNQELISFVQRALGYSLTADVREDVFFVCWGLGRNGKSTLLGTVQRVLGDYAREVAPDVLLKRSEKGDAHPTGVADLVGVRFATARETEEGRHLATALVKAMTGRDRLKARFMRQDYFEFEPTHKLWLATNHKPIINDTTVSIWSRILLIPFRVFFGPEQCDKTLPEKLWEEREGILAWLVQGCLAWQREGLKPPKVVLEAVKEYQSEMDVLQRWLEECCVCDPKAETLFKELYESYETWCKDSDESPISKRAFRGKLIEKGFEVVVLPGNKRGCKGLRLKDEGPSSGESSNSVNQVKDVNDFLYITHKKNSFESYTGNTLTTLTTLTEPEKEEFEQPESPPDPDLNNPGEPIDPSCPVCRHPQRKKIEYLFECGMRVQYLGEKYEIPIGTLYEHAKNHMPLKVPPGVG